MNTEGPTTLRDPDRTRWSKATWAAWLGLLTASTLLVHGYHPLAEDGGVYVAGVFLKLDMTLFPHDAAFVGGPMRYSIFASAMAAISRTLHLPPLWVIFLAYIGSTWLMLFAACQLLRRCVASELARLAGVALVSAWWTLPIAGTSLLLMDPYVTARNFCTPLSLLAMAFALDDWNWRTIRRHRTPALNCLACLLAAFALHRLMAAYALCFVIALRGCRMGRWRVFLLTSTFTAFAVCLLVQHLAPVESPALVAAAITRYYWFLSQWQWYELLGLLGPPAVLVLLERWCPKLTPAARGLCRTCVFMGCLSAVVALLFAHESAPVHMVARLQPLRIFLIIYAVMVLLLGASAVPAIEKLAARTRLPLPAAYGLLVALLMGVATVMGSVQRLTFAASGHIEWPWRCGEDPNPWVQAFHWARENTSLDSLFAIDANYITTRGEDAQTFRAIALRSVLPDYSKDGGEAAITPSLADDWQRGARLQSGLSMQIDADRKRQLAPLGVTWLVLHADAATADACPYKNSTVKVCRLSPVP